MLPSLFSCYLSYQGPSFPETASNVSKLAKEPADGAVWCCLQLSRELQDIMKEQDPSLSADAVADDVYQWDVLLGGFAADSPLGQARHRWSVD